MSEIWTDIAAPRLGRVLGKDDVGDIVGVVHSVLDTPAAADDVIAFRTDTITNLGTSAQAIADFLVKEGGI